jgi:hypothetical protein
MTGTDAQVLAISDYVARTVAAAPVLTPAQSDRLATLLRASID